MIFRFLYLAAILFVAYVIFKLIFANVAINQCKNCEGEGYWKGIRGDRNICKVCAGTGKSK